ncbi:MAG: glycogen/starch synthase, partial [Eubacteriales bacterium]|nr:glycogen/starch synthase [Eubacteriales bacterium]
MIVALPAVLAQEPDTEIRVILPWYRAVREKFGEKTERIAEYRVQLGWRDQHVGLLSLRVGKVRMLFLENDYYFDRDSTYGYYDDGERFAWFSLAATETLHQLDWFPDVLHCSDWQTALIPLFLRILSRGNRRFGEVRTLLTIHNAEYQGKAPIEFARDVLGLREEDIPVMRWDGAVNFLKTGIVCSDRVNAVSRRYARELLDPFYAFGLDRILREQESKLCGIVNGIDTELYDPRRDPFLTANYSRNNPSAKRENKAALQRELGLAVRPDMPLLAMVTRLVSHKGIDLAEQAIPALIDDFP